MSFMGKTASVFGVVGLSASIATLGVVESAEAAKVVLGSDYWITQGGSSFTLGGIEIEVVGDPIETFEGRNVGNADTIVKRNQDVVFTSNGSGKTSIEVIALSLKSTNSVLIPNLGNFDVFVGLDANKKSTGSMIINNNDKVFSSDFTVNWTATFKPVGGGNAIACPFASCSDQIKFKTTGRWTENFPEGATIPEVKGSVGDMLANVHTNLAEDEMDFFPGFSEDMVVKVEHDASGAGHHIVAIKTDAPEDPLGPPDTPQPPAPEPLTILGSATALGFGAFFKKQSSRKRNKKDLS
jgi:hypothetical protein